VIDINTSESSKRLLLLNTCNIHLHFFISQKSKEDNVRSNQFVRPSVYSLHRATSDIRIEK